MKYSMFLLPIIIALQLIVNVVLGVAWIVPGNAQEIPYGFTVDAGISAIEPDQGGFIPKTIKRNVPIDREIITNRWVEKAIKTRD